MTEKLWRAHAKFGAFAYAAAPNSPDVLPARPVEVAEVGGRRTTMRGRCGQRAGARSRPAACRRSSSPGPRIFPDPSLITRCGSSTACASAFPTAMPSPWPTAGARASSGPAPSGSLRVGEGVLATRRPWPARPAAAPPPARMPLTPGARLRELKRSSRALAGARFHRRGTEVPAWLPGFPRGPASAGLPTSQHLHTPVRAALPKETRAALTSLARLHPTPPVGGARRNARLPGFSDWSGALGASIPGPSAWL